jgi:hypothetical protein
MLFGWDSAPDLNTKNLKNSPRFPSITNSESPEQRFRSYGIWSIDFAAEFLFGSEQQLNGTQLLGLGLAESPEYHYCRQLSQRSNGP